MSASSTKRFVRRFLTLGASTALLAGGITAVTTTPAAAHTSYTAISEGCGWAREDYVILNTGGNIISNQAGAELGLVHLVWNGKTGQNCVVTLQTAGHGIPISMEARLGIQSRSGAIAYRTDSGTFGHYAAVKEYTTGQCVNFRGRIAGGVNGRTAFANCG
ncbi:MULTISPECIES: hypothetical protein [unclassified Streptomyces]|uniref:hypothetical protein n=1 Tax=unclassified Streptomyces TaxID=2593676 RepID=UPI0037FDBBB6